MSSSASLDNIEWGIPGALIGEDVADRKIFCAASVLSLLRSAVSRAPDAIAIAGSGARLSYAEMLRLAENAASAIAARVPAGAPVAIILQRTPNAAAALLGCVISGRIALVLDPANPAPRQAALLDAAQPVLLMRDKGLSFPHALAELTLEDAIAGSADGWVPDFEWDPDAPLAVHFTSGSTGLPKGIVFSSRSVLSRALEGIEIGALTAEDRVFAPSVFIVSFGLAFLIGLLSRNARVVLASLATEGAGAVLRLMARERVTHLSMAPPLIRMLLEADESKQAFRAVRSVQTGSMPLARADVLELRTQLPPNCRIVHTYASTEALDLARLEVPIDDHGPEATVPVGMLRPNHDYAILDEDGRNVAPGEAGELVIRSQYIALGEWRDGRLIPGRMPAAPGRPGIRIFRTGDVAKVQPNGLLRVLGRVDRQVKINGVRIEPSEIEAVLRAEPEVDDAAVVAKPGPDGVILTGFVAAAPADEARFIEALRRRLAGALPPTLRPKHLVVLDCLPMLPGGKLDFLELKARAPD